MDHSTLPLRWSSAMDLVVQAPQVDLAGIHNASELRARRFYHRLAIDQQHPAAEAHTLQRTIGQGQRPAIPETDDLAWHMPVVAIDERHSAR